MAMTDLNDRQREKLRKVEQAFCDVRRDVHPDYQFPCTGFGTCEWCQEQALSLLRSLGDDVVLRFDCDLGWIPLLPPEPEAADYRQARGASPLQPGDPLPEDTIRMGRDGK